MTGDRPDRRVRLRGYALAAIVLLLDQLTKRLALGGLELHHPVPVAGNLVRLMLAWNSGAAFSLSWGGPLFLAVFTALAAVLVAVFIWRCRECSPGSRLALGAILGGAAGNLLDRLLYGGSVIDFIDVGLGSSRWPTFNVADIAITLGGIALLLTYRRGAGGRSGAEETGGS